MLITFDGPNGSGKTTIINEVRSRLEHSGYKVYVTKEPTDSEIGNFIKNTEGLFRKYTLANLVVADRHNHIEKEIDPKLREGFIVLCDRYIISSLILQVLDGLSRDEIMKINTGIQKPDLCFILKAKEDTIIKRLREREKLTMFEREYSPKREIELSLEAGNYVSFLGYAIEFIDTEKNINENVSLIIDKIIESDCISEINKV